MTVTSENYRRLLTLCWLGLLGAWTHMLPIGSAQERPPRPKQAEQQKAAEGGDAPATVIEIADGEVVELAGMRAGGQDPQTWLLNRYVRVNCALARRACELSEAEEQKLSQLNSVWVAKQLKESIDSPVKGVAAGIARFLGGRAAAEMIIINNANDGQQQVSIPKVEKRIEAAIDEALEPEHREAFQRERDSRDEFRKQAMAAVLISTLDERVFLTQQQREELEPEVGQWLTKELYWQFYFQNTSYIPDIPKRVLSRVLSAEQLEALEGAQAWNYELSQVELQMMGEEPMVIER